LVESVPLLGELLVTLRSGLSVLALDFLAGVAAFFLALPLAGVPSARDFAMVEVRCEVMRSDAIRWYMMDGSNVSQRGKKPKSLSTRRRDWEEKIRVRTWRGKHCCVGCMRAIKLLECGMRLAGPNNFPRADLRKGRASGQAPHGNSDKAIQVSWNNKTLHRGVDLA
jgi:hypothetical protein